MRKLFTAQAIQTPLKKISLLSATALLLLSSMSGALPLFLNQASAVTPTMVTPIDYQGWQEYSSSGLLSFEDDALKMSTPTGYVMLYRDAVTAEPVENINISYQTKRISGDAHAAPSYVLGIDTDDNSATPEIYAWYEPVYNGGSNYDNWNTWTLDQSAQFWSFDAVGSKGGANGANLFTLADVKATFPVAKVIDYTINMGTGNDGWSALVDYVETAETTYDFEAPAPTTVYVNPSYPTGTDVTHVYGYNAFSTIQDGIDAAATGGTINVTAGTYNENVVVNKVLTLDGAGSDTDPLSNTVVTGTGTGLSLSAGADSINRVVVKDMRVTGFGTGVVASSYNTLENIASVSNTTYGISLNTLDDLVITSSKFNNNAVGLKLASTASANNVTITGSEFNNNSGQGWYSDKGSSSTSYLTNLQISNTTFNNNTNKGFYTEKLSDSVFDNVTVDASGVGGALNHRAGIDLNLKYGSYQNIQILNSSVTNSGTGDPNGAGIIVKARSTGSYASNPATLTSVTLDGLTVTGNGGGGAYASGIRVGEANNALAGSDAGPTGVTILNSVLSGNGTFDLSNVTASTTVTAEYNWWGQTTGPATSQVNGNFTLTPWCEQAACTSFASANESIDLPASGNVASTSTDGNTTLSGTTTSGTVVATFPADTTITATGTGTWDGTLDPPTVTSVTIPGVDGYTTNTGLAISVGSDDFTLSFDKAVKLLFPGQAGKQVGFVKNGVFTEITNDCSLYLPNLDVNLPAVTGDCKTNSGSDLVVWTKHFTTFATFTRTAVVSTPSTTPTSTVTKRAVASNFVASLGSNVASVLGVAAESGAVKGTATDKGTPKVATTQKPEAGRFLGLGWFWLPVLAVVFLAVYYGLLARRADKA